MNMIIQEQQCKGCTLTHPLLRNNWEL